MPNYRQNICLVQFYCLLKTITQHHDANERIVLCYSTLNVASHISVEIIQQIVDIPEILQIHFNISTVWL
jgi:hypothetical protein